METWTEWMNASGSELYDSVFASDTDTSSNTRTFTTTMNLKKGSYNVVIQSVREYWYSGETFDVSVDNGTYTILEEHSVMPCYGGHKVLVLKVEMSNDGVLTVTGTGQKRQHNTIIAFV